MRLLTAARRVFASRSTPWWVKVLPLVAVLYVLSPIDLLPDVAPILGWLDDAGILALAIGLVLRAAQAQADRDELAARDRSAATPVRSG